MTGLGEILEENSRLRDFVRERDARLDAQSEQLRVQAALIAELDLKLAAVQASNDQFKRYQEFIEKRNELAAAERLRAAELQAKLPLFTGEAVAPPRDPEVEKGDAENPADGKKDGRKSATHERKGRRNVKDLAFPTTTFTAPVNASTCDTCGGDRELVEPRVSHRVGWVPGHFTVVEARQERCRCPKCPKAPVWVAPEPFLLAGAMCDDGMVARVIVDWAGDHLPFNRQADRMTREGFPINQNVLSGWSRAAWLAGGKRLVQAVEKQVAESPVIQGDDTGHPVQDGTDGKLASGRLWVYTDQRQAFFAFSRTKQGEHPADLLERLGAHGRSFVVDGGSEYNLAEQRLALSRGGCWSHFRRYFFNAAIQHDEGNTALVTLRDLFLVERDLAELDAAGRLAGRELRSKPLVDGLYRWIKDLARTERPKSKLSEALGYALSQEARMRLFLTDGHLPFHNNLSELLLRQPVVGRKNWLFSGSEGGAEAAAGWFSLIASCRLQGIDPWTYLYDVFGRLLDHPAKRVHELTPRSWRLQVEAGTIVPRSPAQPR
jgi:transposase